MKFSDLFKDKYKSQMVRDHIEKLIRDMANLKMRNYENEKSIEIRSAEIKKLEEALVDLGINIEPGFDPETFYDGDE